MLETTKSKSVLEHLIRKLPLEEQEFHKKEFQKRIQPQKEKQIVEKVIVEKQNEFGRTVYQAVEKIVDFTPKINANSKRIIQNKSGGQMLRMD